MAFNIVDLVASQMTPDNIRAMASLLGESHDKVGSAVSGGTPAVLGSLISSLEHQSNKAAFERAINDTDDGILDDIAGALTGRGNSLVGIGQELLGGILGGKGLGSLARALAKFSGLSGESSNSLLGMLAPLLFGSLKRKARSDSMDIGGLIDLLRGQKHNVAAAIPSSLGRELSGTGLLQGVMDTGDKVAATAARTAAQAGDAAEEAASAGGSLLKKILPLILLLIAAFLIFQMLNRPSEPEVVTAPGGEMLASLNTEMEGMVSDTVDTLRSVNSPQSAQLAVENLSSVDRSLDNLLGLVDGMPPSQSSALAATATRLLPGLKSASASAREIPGVEPVIGSYLDSIESKLTRLSQR